jgi:hypothetical protein
VLETALITAVVFLPSVTQRQHTCPNSVALGVCESRDIADGESWSSIWAAGR